MLPAEDLKLVVEKLGRRPNALEQSIFLNLWSEHCSYRSSAALLRHFKTDGENVIIGPGDDAAIVKFDEEYVVSIAMESHNHPSYIDPYSGSATGVGGIVRDIISMGTKPVAVMAPFYSGPLTSEKNRWLFDNILKGAADYSKTIEVAAVRGESYFDKRYSGNPLVNVVAVGIGKKEQVMTSVSTAAGNRFILYGSKTGRDGLGGAAFSSGDMSEEGAPDKSTIPAGNAELEKRVIDATLEIIEKGWVKSCRDLGAAGLSGASSEMAEKGGFGFHVVADNIPALYDNLTVYELMLSETQERMLIEVHPNDVPAVMEVMKAYDIDAADIGYLTKEPIFKIEFKGKIEAEIPIEFLIKGVPKVEMESKEPPKRNEKLISQKPDVPKDMKACLLTVLSSENLASRKPVWEAFKEATLPCVIGEVGGDAGMIRITDSKGLAMTCGCEPAVGLLEPYAAGMMTVIENAMNLAVKGSKSLCLVDNLNFGNPNKPEQYWTFKQSVLGLSDAAQKLNIPVVGGNVSLYNESTEFDTAILPTPSIGILGMIDLEKKIPSSFFKEADETILLIGTTTNEMGGSEYNRVCGLETAGSVPKIPENYGEIIAAVSDVCATGTVTSAHDVSRGGLAKALTSMLTNVGAKVDLSGIAVERADDLLFSEAPARAILTVKSTDQIKEILKDIPCVVIGKTVKDSTLEIKTKIEEIRLTKAEIEEAASTLEKEMKLGYEIE